MSKKRIIIDTDMGVDDSLAVLLAIASSEIKVEAITTVSGACMAEQGVINALAILELTNATHIPVAQGMRRPLVQPPIISSDVHNTSGMGYANLPEPSIKATNVHGVDLLIEKIMAEPDEITLVTIGPLTNLAMAIRREPRLIRDVKEVISMGGAINESGNMTPQAEFNIFFDPHAAHIVFHSGLPLTLVPIDVTYKTILTQTDLDQLAEISSPISGFILNATRFYLDFYKKNRNMDGCAMNDPLALALTFAPQLVDLEEIFVDIDISGGVSMGKTYADIYRVLGKDRNLKVASNVRSKDFIQIFIERMKRLSRALPD